VIETQRVPALPRPPAEPGRAVETVPGTQVYRAPEAAVRMPDPAQPADTVRAPAQPARELIPISPAPRQRTIPAPDGQPSGTAGSTPPAGVGEATGTPTASGEATQ